MNELLEIINIDLARFAAVTWLRFARFRTQLKTSESHSSIVIESVGSQTQSMMLLGLINLLVSLAFLTFSFYLFAIFI